MTSRQLACALLFNTFLKNGTDPRYIQSSWEDKDHSNLYSDQHQRGGKNKITLEKFAYINTIPYICFCKSLAVNCDFYTHSYPATIWNVYASLRGSFANTAVSGQFRKRHHKDKRQKENLKIWQH